MRALYGDCVFRAEPFYPSELFVRLFVCLSCLPYVTSSSAFIKDKFDNVGRCRSRCVISPARLPFLQSSLYYFYAKGNCFSALTSTHHFVLQWVAQWIWLLFPSLSLSFPLSFPLFLPSKVISFVLSFIPFSFLLSFLFSCLFLFFCRFLFFYLYLDLLFSSHVHKQARSNSSIPEPL